MMVERQVNPAARQSLRGQAKRPAWRRHVAGTRDATRLVLCVQRLNALSGNAIDLAFAWDPTEPVATRPITMQRQGGWNFFYTHDGNKNVSELVFFQQANGIAAHYEYAPFGAVTATSKSTPVAAYDFCECNPFRFSSEYADNALGLVYYNYRHYNPVDGRWTSRDSKPKVGHLYEFVENSSLGNNDRLGLELLQHMLGDDSWRDTEEYEYEMHFQEELRHPKIPDGSVGLSFLMATHEFTFEDGCVYYCISITPMDLLGAYYSKTVSNIYNDGGQMLPVDVSYGVGRFARVGHSIDMTSINASGGVGLSLLPISVGVRMMCMTLTEKSYKGCPCKDLEPLSVAGMAL